jgi:hypothetical protein
MNKSKNKRDTLRKLFRRVPFLKSHNILTFFDLKHIMYHIKYFGFEVRT